MELVAQITTPEQKAAVEAYVEALGGKLEIYARMGKKTHRLID